MITNRENTKKPNDVERPNRVYGLKELQSTDWPDKQVRLSFIWGKPPTMRTKSEVMFLRTEGAVFGGCCDKHADRSPCSCMELARARECGNVSVRGLAGGTAMAKYSTRKVAPPFISRNFLVRCLGPGPEHTFWSSDRCRHRICPKCARVIDGNGYIRLSPIIELSIKSDGRVNRHKEDG